MEHWISPPKPAEYAEDALVAAILNGTYPPGGALPAERELAAQLGVTRPTVREALQRLSRDGWVLIRQGKSTVVNDIWRDGGLNVLSGVLRHREHMPPEFIPNLLRVRCDLAPAYARTAVERNGPVIVDYLAGAPEQDADPAIFAQFDWHLHRTLAIASTNPIYALILNGFAGFYELMASQYFAFAEARAASVEFYAALRRAAEQSDGPRAQALTHRAMELSLMLWSAQASQLHRNQ